MNHRIQLKLNRIVDMACIATGARRRMVKRRNTWHARYEQMLEELERRHFQSVSSHFMIETAPYAESMTHNHLCIQFAHQGLDLPQEKRLSTLIKLLEVLRSYFSQHQIEYWIDSGTLLGAYRDGHLIPWDDDADICLQEKTLPRLLNIVSAYPFDDLDCLLIFRKAKDVFGNQILPADSVPCILVNRHNGVFVDFFLCHELNERWLKVYWPWFSYKCQNFGIKYHKSTIFPLKPLLLEGQEYPSPNQTVKYLKRLYGDLRPRRTIM